MNHHYSTHQINVPHNLTHSGRYNQYVTIGYDIIMGDIQVYVSQVGFDTLRDIKDMKRFEKHCTEAIRAKHNPDPWQPTEADIQAHEAWVAAGEPY